MSLHYHPARHVELIINIESCIDVMGQITVILYVHRKDKNMDSLSHTHDSSINLLSEAFSVLLVLFIGRSYQWVIETNELFFFFSILVTKRLISLRMTEFTLGGIQIYPGILRRFYRGNRSQ